MILTLKDISFKYLDKDILKETGFTINENEKIGIIGVNGAGKSTLLKLIVGELEPTTGVIFRSSELAISYLPQEVEYHLDNDLITEVKRLIKLSNRHLNINNYNEHEEKTILNKLGLAEYDKRVGSLSGGELKRLSLAATLIAPGNLLILDEPTNHLDIMMIDWLEKYLLKIKKALLLVTHDRYFLERITKKTIEIELAKVYIYDGGYQKFLTLKAERMQALNANARRLSSILKKEAKWMAMNPQARTTKSKERIERFEKLNDKMVELSDKMQANASAVTFQSSKNRIGKKTIIIEKVAKSIDGRLLFTDFNYILKRYDRLGIVGPNGSGKTTLLKTIMGLIEPDTGSIITGETICIGYFEQTKDILQTDIKIIDYLKKFGEYIDTPTGRFSAAQLLENYGFPPAIQQLQIKRLSGGEKKRLQLLATIIQNPNVLVLDEPTNDLDLYTLEILEDYLEDFLGAIIVISHDRYFLDRVCEHLLIFSGANLKEFTGSISQYLETNTFATSTKKNPQKIKNISTIPAFTSAEKKEFTSIEDKIIQLEEQLKTLTLEEEKYSSDYQKLMLLVDEKAKINRELEEKLIRWEYLNEINEKIILYKKEKSNE